MRFIAINNLSLTVIFYTLTAICNPVPQPPAAQGNPNCLDPKSGYTEACWEQLKLTQFLMDRESGWRSKMKFCKDIPGNNHGVNCCEDGLPWSRCFLKIATGKPSDCTTVSLQVCPPTSTKIVIQEEIRKRNFTEAMQWYHITQTIYSMYPLVII